MHIDLFDLFGCPTLLRLVAMPPRTSNPTTPISFYETLSSPIGAMLLVSDSSGALTHLYTRNATSELSSKHPDAIHDPTKLSEAKNQMNEYLKGQRKQFTLKLAPKGSEFQQSVWSSLQGIPFGESSTYANLAKDLGISSARAIGRANATNPISIIIPCHRLVGTDGRLTGYAGGLEAKEWLLKHEGIEVEKGRVVKNGTTVNRKEKQKNAVLDSKKKKKKGNKE